MNPEKIAALAKVLGTDKPPLAVDKFRLALGGVLDGGACLDLINYLQGNTGETIRNLNRGDEIDDTTAGAISFLLALSVQTDFDQIRVVAPLLGVKPPETRPGLSQARSIARKVFETTANSQLKATIETLTGITGEATAGLVATPPVAVTEIARRQATANVRAALIRETAPEWLESLKLHIVEEKWCRLLKEQVIVDDTAQDRLSVLVDTMLKKRGSSIEQEAERLEGGSRKQRKSRAAALAKESLREQMLTEITDDELAVELTARIIPELVREKLPEAMTIVMDQLGLTEPEKLGDAGEILKVKNDLIGQTQAIVEALCRPPRTISPGRWRYQEIETKELTALESAGIDDILYRTPESTELMTRLGPQKGKLPWRYFAEGPYQSENKSFFDEFGSNLYLARKLVRKLASGDERVGSPELRTFVSTIIEYATPPFFPIGLTPLESPVMFDRPDFVRKVENGKVRYVATELEDSPGAIGISLIVAAGYAGACSDLPEKFIQFMNTVKLSPGNEIDRDRLTVLTTGEWPEYVKDALVFLRELEKGGKQTDLVTIEELADLPESEVDRRIGSGLVFNFAYLGNFFKDPSRYWINLLQKPRLAAKLSGSDLSSILKCGEKQLEMIQQQIIDKVVAGFRQDPGVSPFEILKQEVSQLYFGEVDQKIVSAGRTLAEKMASAARSAYRRQGKDLLVFNDPGMGTVINGKNDLAIFSLPEFRDLFADTYGNVSILEENLATTFPLLPETGIWEIDKYVGDGIRQAENKPNKWILKVVSDPELGQLDWGGRGCFGWEGDDDEWRRLIKSARNNRSIPFVLQEVVQNTPFSSERSSTKGVNIREISTEQIGVFDRNPGSITYGELIPAESALARVSPFLFSYENTDGGLTVDTAVGLATIAVGAKTKVHGSTASVEAPILFTGQKEKR